MTIALDDTIALVTGANGGIGREVCKAMKAANAIVIATDLGANADDTECDLYLELDVVSPSSWNAVESEQRRRWGRLDGLVHVAGLALVEKFEETSLETFYRINSVNVDGIIVGTQILLPLLKESGKIRKGGASIVNFSSAGGLRGAPFNAAYCTSKASVKMLSKCLGAEFAALGYNIRVNSLHPGGIDTGMASSMIDRFIEMELISDRETAAIGYSLKHPIGRLGQPAEIGGGVVYLCSEAANFVTCSEFLIDGVYTRV